VLVWCPAAFTANGLGASLAHRREACLRSTYIRWQALPRPQCKWSSAGFPFGLRVFVGLFVASSASCKSRLCAAHLSPTIACLHLLSLHARHMECACSPCKNAPLPCGRRSTLIPGRVRYPCSIMSIRRHSSSALPLRYVTLQSQSPGAQLWLKGTGLQLQGVPGTRMTSRGPLCLRRHTTHVPQTLGESISRTQQAVCLRRARVASGAMVPGALLGLAVTRAQQADHLGRARAAVVADAGHQPPRAQPRDRLPQLLERAVLGVGHLRRARSARCSRGLRRMPDKERLRLTATPGCNGRSCM